jgi:hypothetical protein
MVQDAPSARQPTLIPDITLLNVGTTAGCGAKLRAGLVLLKATEEEPALRVSILSSC